MASEGQAEADGSGAGKGEHRVTQVPPDPPFNPFINLTVEPSTWEWIKMVLLLPTLGLVRVLLLVVVAALVVGWCRLCTLGMDGNEPMSRTRQSLIRPVMQCLARAVLFILGFYHIRVKGQRAPSSEAPILVSNHISYFEPIFFASCGVSHIAKAEIKSWMFIGSVAEAMQTVFVDRSNRKSCDAVKAAINSRAAHPGEWPTMCLYPEGTITNGSSIIQFKHGAFYPGAPLQAAVVRYRAMYFDPSTTYGAKHYWLRMFSQVYNKMEVEFLPVHVPTAAEQEDPHAYAEAVRVEMARALNVTTTDFALGDALLQYAAQKNHIPRDSAIVEWGKLEELFTSLSVNEAKTLLAQFATLDENHNGMIDYTEFKTCLELDDRLAESLFARFDQRNTGTINFKEFIAAAHYLHENVSNEEAVEMVIELLRDRHADTEKIAEADFRDVAQSLEGVDDGEAIRLFHEMNGGKPATSNQLRRLFKAHANLLSVSRKLRILSHFKQPVAEKLVGLSGGRPHHRRTSVF